MNWIIMPVVNNLDMTLTAITDGLDQTGVEPRVLVVAQGVSDEIRATLEGFAEREPRLLCWFHTPPLPSLSASWNRALEFVWGVGGTEALVVNNDLRLHPETYRILLRVLEDQQALFVSAVGVREGQFDPHALIEVVSEGEIAKGGPDFSCFLLSKEGHAKYPFDESFIPAYREDCSAHREYMLGGDGHRIFSVNLPYLHYASGTVNAYTPAQRQAFAKRSEVSRQHYLRSWGGEVNHERFTQKGDPTSAMEGVTNPELQRRVLAGEPVLEEEGVAHVQD